MSQFVGNIKTMKIPCIRVGYEGRKGGGGGYEYVDNEK